ncbi:diguanylate cyclase (GGDEF)-like protein [Roseibium hamelinense]|uniref:Diguanylate cyclase (GGDEF)-like protein n=1 Tax=Roseibium hamelinense TaxID=150831 RepID=A0A562TAJ0_9HYPH|nr:bifunctional diguanylate cyclase/phosphodiesterase [Roseibium hamelinense]MTI45450.1 bifunctional diguanylate cyclase/phosphodiesterase [Roseibium hamelinense]TWI90178.1 diguanylate cyclase (GGDEF)-like protein [Roseibium hamelinense]
MKQGSALTNVAVFTVTLLLVVTLALGVYGSNRLLTYWLLAQSAEQIVAQVTDRIKEAGIETQFSIETEPDLDVGLRLRTLETEETSENAPARLPREISPVFRETIENALQPMVILADTFVSLADTHGDDEAAATLFHALNAERSVTRTGISRHAVFTALNRLEDSSAPYVAIDMNWWGKLNPNGIAVIPNLEEPPFRLPEAVGGLIVLVNQTALIQRISGIIHITTFVIAILCAGSVFVAGFLLWMRFHDQVRTNQDIEFLAHHDALTSLPNRAVFNAKLNEGLRLAQAKASNLGVMLIDVDRFKEINDTYGHATGDIFLQIIADRLRSVFGDHLVARLSGDEFAVMTMNVSDIARLTRLASELIASTEDPCFIDGKEIKISLSVGMARANDGNWRASRLLHCADLALYRAKHAGRSTFAWYTPDMDADAQKRKEIEAGLAKALKFDQFELLFQPQYSLSDNKLKAYESLIRWNHPTKGYIAPDVFIPIAEDCGLISSIGDWVLEQACREASTWKDPALRVAVNVSAAQFLSGDTVHKVAHALQTSGLAAERLEIEITESLLISNTEKVVETLNKIRDMGVSIAMDDFGTGYSSLSYLSKFPFDKIKIDRSFIHNLGQDASTDAIVTSIIGLGRSLDVTITAEGVENQEQVTLLRAAGCNLVQGFLYGRPDTVQSHERLMAERDAKRTRNDHSFKVKDTEKNSPKTTADPAAPRPSGSGFTVNTDNAKLKTGSNKPDRKEPPAGNGSAAAIAPIAAAHQSD